MFSCMVAHRGHPYIDHAPFSNALSSVGLVEHRFVTGRGSDEQKDGRTHDDVSHKV